MTFEECKVALGKQTGVAFKVIDKKEIIVEEDFTWASNLLKLPISMVITMSGILIQMSTF